MSSRTILLLLFLTTYKSFGGGAIPALSTFPKVDRIWMGLEDGVIRPKNYDSFKMDTAKFILVHATDGQTLKKDQHWLTIEPDELNLERRTLSLEEKKSKLKLRDEKWNNADVIEKKELSLDELNSKKEELNDFLEQQKDLGGLHKRIQKALVDIETKINRVQTQLDPKIVKQELELIESEGVLELERKRKRLDVLERRSIIKASFEGQLKFSDAFKEKLKESKGLNEPIWVDINTTIATLVDEKHYEAVVKLTNDYSRKARPDDLIILLQDSQTGSLIKGEFDREEQIETGVGVRQNYVFMLNKLDVNIAKHSSSETHFVHIYRKFSKAHSLVHKKDIAFIAPAILKKSGWSGLVKHLWPQSAVLQVGPQTIMIKSLDEN